MFVINLCKLNYEDNNTEIIEEIFFEKFSIKDEKFILHNFYDLQKIEKSLSDFSSYIEKDVFSCCFIYIESWYKLTTEVKELNIANRFHLSKNFNFNGKELYIEFDLELDSIENNIVGLEEFKKKGELLSHLSNEIIGKKRWLNFTRLEKKYWLDFTFSQMSERGNPLALNITVDGKYLACEEDVYCYFGEAVYGVLGYLGNNFNAFSDEVSDLRLKIKWINFEYSRDNFESKEGFYYLDDFVNVLKKYSSLEILY
ncbi:MULTISPECIES: hypothetical protein [Acinetobacter]|uniref:hypothetical protein n=1 Tax=Acinetobacter TaxID=469 RepID=UPI001022AE86|nr:MULTISPECIES: hypothetical protein [Acinetobacter]MDS7927879.1 hypothetical protein [Acinetobacter sp. V115_6]RZH13016.1 hypothetical protein EXE02_06735 [Acinetobacter pittii]